MTADVGPDVGSLFSGYAGLDMAVTAALGGSVAWHCEIEAAPAKVLAHHHPGVPNHGDITAVNWADVQPIDVLTGGFPCQDVSSAGRRRGIRPGTRSGLWQHMAYAIDQLRPQLVVVENVRGLLSADAACDVEPCPWCLGDDEGRPLRALGAVLGDLADLGYDARWGGLRAADVGAPHGRYRIFITAWPGDRGRASADPCGCGVCACGVEAGRGLVATAPGGAELRGDRDGSDTAAADASSGELQRRRVGGVLAGTQGTGAGEGPERERHRDAVGDGRAAATHSEGDRRDEVRPEPVRDAGRAEPAGSDRSTLADADGVGPVRGGAARGRRGGPTDDDLAAPDASRAARGGTQPEHLEAPTGPAAEPGERTSPPVWGQYEPAIRRWELILGRPAPAPTMTGARGGQQLSPAFVEWMMGLPAGWVTAVPGISRNEQLKMLGNGVVPQQAEAALRWLLASASEVAA